MIKRVIEGNRTNVQLSMDDRVVSSAGVIDFQARIGDVHVRMGGIAGVSTVREYRGRGLSRQVLTDCVALQTEQDYDLSMLFGIPEYYQKYGYGCALIDSKASVRLRYAEEAQARYETRPMEPRDVEAVRDIYNRMTASKTATIVRSENWAGFRRGADWRGRFGADVLIDGEKIVGYVVYQANLWDCQLAEAGYVGPEVFSTLLALMARDALEKRIDTITIHAAPDDPFLVYCRRYGCHVEVDYPASGSGMARVINQSGLLNKLQPLFTARLSEADCDWAGELVVETDLGRDSLVFGSDGAVTTKIPQWMLAQLVLGYRSVDDALFETEAEVSDGALPILNVLFPEGYPYMWATDHF